MAGKNDKKINDYLQKRLKYWSFSFTNKDAMASALGFDSWKEGTTEYTDEQKAKVAEFTSNLKRDTIVTGGCIASMLLGEDINDIDIYFANQETARVVSQYYLAEMNSKLEGNDRVSDWKVIDNDTGGVAIFIKSQGIAGEEIETSQYQYFEMLELNAIDEFFEKYRAKFDKERKHAVRMMTSNAITLNNGIQIILRFAGDPATIHENFDFVHATNYWTEKTGVVYKIDALKALLQRRLIYVGSKYPVSSLFRIRKFLKRGFTISAGEITKIAYDVSKLDLDDPKVLHDQLVGVDYAYFREVISILSKNSDRQLDRTYLFSIIEQVFDGGEEHDDEDADTDS